MSEQFKDDNQEPENMFVTDEGVPVDPFLGVRDESQLTTTQRLLRNIQKGLSTDAEAAHPPLLRKPSARSMIPVITPKGTRELEPAGWIDPEYRKTFTRPTIMAKTVQDFIPYTGNEKNYIPPHIQEETDKRREEIASIRPVLEAKSFAKAGGRSFVDALKFFSDLIPFTGASLIAGAGYLAPKLTEKGLDIFNAGQFNLEEENLRFTRIDENGNTVPDLFAGSIWRDIYNEWNAPLYQRSGQGWDMTVDRFNHLKRSSVGRFYTGFRDSYIKPLSNLTNIPKDKWHVLYDATTFTGNVLFPFGGVGALAVFLNQFGRNIHRGFTAYKSLRTPVMGADSLEGVTLAGPVARGDAAKLSVLEAMAFRPLTTKFEKRVEDPKILFEEIRLDPDLEKWLKLRGKLEKIQGLSSGITRPFKESMQRRNMANFMLSANMGGAYALSSTWWDKPEDELSRLGFGLVVGLVPVPFFSGRGVKVKSDMEKSMKAAGKKHGRTSRPIVQTAVNLASQLGGGLSVAAHRGLEGLWHMVSAPAVWARLKKDKSFNPSKMESWTSWKLSWLTFMGYTPRQIVSSWGEGLKASHKARRQLETMPTGAKKDALKDRFIKQKLLTETRTKDGTQLQLNPSHLIDNLMNIPMAETRVVSAIAGAMKSADLSGNSDFADILVDSLNNLDEIAKGIDGVDGPELRLQLSEAISAMSYGSFLEASLGQVKLSLLEGNGGATGLARELIRSQLESIQHGMTEKVKILDKALKTMSLREDASDLTKNFVDTLQHYRDNMMSHTGEFGKKIQNARKAMALMSPDSHTIGMRNYMDFSDDAFENGLNAKNYGERIKTHIFGGTNKNREDYNPSSRYNLIEREVDNAYTSAYREAKASNFNVYFDPKIFIADEEINAVFSSLRRIMNDLPAEAWRGTGLSGPKILRDARENGLLLGNKNNISDMSLMDRNEKILDKMLLRGEKSIEEVRSIKTEIGILDESGVKIRNEDAHNKLVNFLIQQPVNVKGHAFIPMSMDLETFETVRKAVGAHKRELVSLYSTNRTPEILAQRDAAINLEQLLDDTLKNTVDKTSGELGAKYKDIMDSIQEARDLYRLKQLPFIGEQGEFSHLPLAKMYQNALGTKGKADKYNPRDYFPFFISSDINIEKSAAQFDILAGNGKILKQDDGSSLLSDPDAYDETSVQFLMNAMHGAIHKGSRDLDIDGFETHFKHIFETMGPNYTAHFNRFVESYKALKKEKLSNYTHRSISEEFKNVRETLRKAIDEAVDMGSREMENLPFLTALDLAGKDPDGLIKFILKSQPLARSKKPEPPPLDTGEWTEKGIVKTHTAIEELREESRKAGEFSGTPLDQIMTVLEGMGDKGEKAIEFLQRATINYIGNNSFTIVSSTIADTSSAKLRRMREEYFAQTGKQIEWDLSEFKSWVNTSNKYNLEDVIKTDLDLGKSINLVKMGELLQENRNILERLFKDNPAHFEYLDAIFDISKRIASSAEKSNIIGLVGNYTDQMAAGRLYNALKGVVSIRYLFMEAAFMKGRAASQELFKDVLLNPNTAKALHTLLHKGTFDLNQYEVLRSSILHAIARGGIRTLWGAEEDEQLKSAIKMEAKKSLLARQDEALNMGEV
jgi:hypothetical protein